jgi:hypothetical protein
MAKQKIASLAKPPAPVPQADQLLGDLRQMIEAARARVATAANAELTLHYWRMGRRIHSEILAGERAGETVVEQPSHALVRELSLNPLIFLARCLANAEVLPGSLLAGVSLTSCERIANQAPKRETPTKQMRASGRTTLTKKYSGILRHSKPEI